MDTCSTDGLFQAWVMEKFRNTKICRFTHNYTSLDFSALYRSGRTNITYLTEYLVFVSWTKNEVRDIAYW